MTPDDTLWHALDRARALFRVKDKWDDRDITEYAHLKPHLIDLCRLLTAKYETEPADDELAELLEEVRSYLPRPEA